MTLLSCRLRTGLNGGEPGGQALVLLALAGTPGSIFSMAWWMQHHTAAVLSLLGRIKFRRILAYLYKAEAAGRVAGV